jgi:hypothetical protein
MSDCPRLWYLVTSLLAATTTGRCHPCWLQATARPTPHPLLATFPIATCLIIAVAVLQISNILELVFISTRRLPPRCPKIDRPKHSRSKQNRSYFQSTGASLLPTAQSEKKISPFTSASGSECHYWNGSSLARQPSQSRKGSFGA